MRAELWGTGWLIGFPEPDLLLYEEEQPSASIRILARDNFLSVGDDLDTRLC
jgi:hypothetical protein